MTLKQTDLILQDGAGIGTVTTGDSNAGLVRITARDEVRITGRNSSNRKATSNIYEFLLVHPLQGILMG